ncbi:hypothetical protein GCM10023259_098550 [Thermocatellispora tengchongensis]
MSSYVEITPQNVMTPIAYSAEASHSSLLLSRMAACPIVNGVPTPQVNMGTSAHMTVRAVGVPDCRGGGGGGGAPYGPGTNAVGPAVGGPYPGCPPPP